MPVAHGGGSSDDAEYALKGRRRRCKPVGEAPSPDGIGDRLSPSDTGSNGFRIFGKSECRQRCIKLGGERCALRRVSVS